VSSTDPAVGWGGTGGYVYQKAYLEFFCSRPLLDRLTETAKQWPSLTYTAVNVKGDVVTNLNVEDKTVNAVTWGVFPNKEIIQPTIVDVDSFMAWKDEAFALWVSQWRDVYDIGSDSWKLIDRINQEYYLVNVVDNDYVKGDMFAFFQHLLQ
jgi:methylenetetrahydrofolate reductase (NADPH)